MGNTSSRGTRHTLFSLLENYNIYQSCLVRKKRPLLYIRTTFENPQWGFCKNSSNIFILSLLLYRKSYSTEFAKTLVFSGERENHKIKKSKKNLCPSTNIRTPSCNLSVYFCHFLKTFFKNLVFFC